MYYLNAQRLGELQVDGITGETLNGLELKAKAIALAVFLRDQCKVRAGDVIAISSENRLEFAITVHAVILLAAVVAPINNSYTPRMNLGYKICNATT